MSLKFKGGFRPSSGRIKIKNKWLPYVSSVPVTAGLAVHFDATSLRGIVDGAELTSWTDTIGTYSEGESYYVGSSYNIADKNGLATVTLPLGARVTYGNDTAPHNGAYSTFTAFKPLSYEIYQTVIDKRNWGGGGNYDVQYHLGVYDTNRMYTHAGSHNGQLNYGGLWPANNTWAIIENHVGYNGSATVELRKNGAGGNLGTLSGRTPNAPANTMNCFGVNGVYAEQLIYTTSLTTQNKNDIRAYLNAKWAIY